MYRAPAPVQPTMPKARPDRPEIRSIADVIGLFQAALDAADIAVVAGSETFKGFSFLLPEGRVRLVLEHGRHVPLTSPDDPAPSDQFPVFDGSALSCYSPTADD